MSTAIAALKFAGFFLLCCVVVPLQTLILLVYKGRYSYILPHLWHKGVCALFRITVGVKGHPVKDSHVVYVSNHISYLDIPAIATQLCFASFVAKQDVSGWPVFGYLSKLQQTIFINRSKSAARRESNALENNLAAGKNLIIFPEGTSTEGIEVKPFKSSLFSLFLNEKFPNILIQPFTLSLSSVNNSNPQSREDRLIYAWPFDDDTPLGAHLWRFARSKGAHITLNFHAPVKASNFSDRKTLAKACQDAVSNGLSSEHLV